MFCRALESGIRGVDTIIDPYWNDVALLIQNDGANVIDQSPHAHAITKSGVGVASDGFCSFYNYGNYLNINNDPVFVWNNTTIEFLLKINSFPPSGAQLSGLIDISSYNNLLFRISNTRGVEIRTTGSATTKPYTFSYNTLIHICFVINGQDLDCFINGANVHYHFLPSNVQKAAIRIGCANHAGNEYFNGLLKTRITNNIRYTANFTPPTEFPVG